jgi:SAM-dependent methyltransferase
MEIPMEHLSRADARPNTASPVHRLLGTLARRFRRRRLRRFLALFPEVGKKIEVLDVGGYSGEPWREFDCPATVTLVNIGFGAGAARPDERAYRFVIADGRALPFRDQAFDLAYSNSVIEHVGGWPDQVAFARELRRAASWLYCQTPNRGFPIEPHIVAPFLHWLPDGVQRRTVRWLSVWGWMARPTRQEAAEFLHGIRLLGEAELRRLFPACRIERERCAGLTKSFVVVRR